MRAGVYALRHERKGSVYIGSSSDLDARRRAWSSAIGRHLRGAEVFNVPRVVLDAVTDTCRDDWCFVILEEMPNGYSKGELLAREAALVREAMSRFGERCLNATYSDGEPLRVARARLEDL